MPILYAGDLPPGALVEVKRRFAPAPIWLTADAASLAFSQKHPDRVISWRAANGMGIEAQAVAANKIGTSYRSDPPRLQFEAEDNGGLVVPDAISDARTATFALIFRPDGSEEPRTLLALQIRGDDDYLFLSGEGGSFRVAQKSGSSELAISHDSGEAASVLVICALADGQVKLAVNDAPTVAADIERPPTGRADLFIGCRNARAGLRRKLGRFSLTDVMVWPGHDLLSYPDNPALHHVRALRRARDSHDV